MAKFLQANTIHGFGQVRMIGRWRYDGQIHILTVMRALIL
jgi:hypothetical protein